MASELLLASKEMPIVAILGPRQSGKSTLAKSCFPAKEYVSLENLDHRSFAQSDPLGFLARYKAGAVIDEVQCHERALPHEAHARRENEQSQLLAGVVDGAQMFKGDREYRNGTEPGQALSRADDA